MNLLPKLQLNAFSSVTMDFQETYAHIICVLEFKFNIDNQISQNHLFTGQMSRVLNPSENKKSLFKSFVFVLCRCRVLSKCNVFWNSKIRLDEVYVLNSSYEVFAERPINWTVVYVFSLLIHFWRIVLSNKFAFLEVYQTGSKKFCPEFVV